VLLERLSAEFPLRNFVVKHKADNFQFSINPTTLSGFLAPKAIKPERAYFVAFWGVFK